ncbi:MAG TPA: hypothetical protein VGZ33_02110 [Acidimicrobiales bacterium]|nr:hypothetical protein [Acidimicrobiales bacterium]
MPTQSAAGVRAPSDPSAPHRRGALVVGGVAYLAVGVAMFWNVLTLSVTRGTTCACSDASLFAWFFEWPLVALSHGHNPFYSSAMFHPQGINLLSNTSVTAWSFVLLPITAIFGPIASLNVALVVAPACSGLAAMWVAQRWVRSSLAAFVAGALYAFSPIVLFQSAGAHLMVTSLVVPPLVLACLDELFWRRRHRPLRVGVALGALLVVQFFMGTEMLVMLAVATGLSLLVLGVFALVRDRTAATAAIRHGAPGLAVALGLGAVVLAWPAFYALAGPGHYVGAIWPGIAPAQASLRSFVVAVPGTVLWWSLSSGRLVRPTFLGPTLVATLLVGLVVFRRCARLWAAVAVTGVVAWLALGQHYAFGAWHYAHHLPVLRDVMNERFAALLFLPAGIALALVLDQLVRWRPGRLGAAVALVVGAACVTPLALNAANGLPYAASKVWEPLWYQRNADALPAGQVVLGFPFFNTSADLLSVQALHKMHYAVVGGTGPEWIDARQGKEEPGYRVLKQVASLALAPDLASTATAPQRADVLDALSGWGVTYVVVPVARGPNTSVVARAPARVARWLASVLGPPQRRDGAWVWYRGPTRGP